MKSFFMVLLFSDEFHDLAVFGGYTHHVNTSLILAHVEGGHVTVGVAFVNHLADGVHHGDVIDARCKDVHIVGGGVGVDGDGFVAFVDPVVTIDINHGQPTVGRAGD